MVDLDVSGTAISYLVKDAEVPLRGKDTTQLSVPSSSSDSLAAESGEELSSPTPSLTRASVAPLLR